MDERYSMRVIFLISPSLLQAVDEYATEVSRKRSSIIREALAKFLEDKRQKELEELMREGYQATAEQSLKIHREFEHAHRELDWDY